MEKILVLFDNTIYYWKWLLPLKWCKKEFKNNNLKIYFDKRILFKIIYNLLKKQSTHYDYKMIDKLLFKRKYDTVILSFHYNHSFFKMTEEERIKIFDLIRKHCKKIIWLDPSDSTGTTTFSVLPYVDLYLKKQLLKNKQLYFNHIYGKRLYTQYYHDLYGLTYDDSIISKDDILKKEYLKKIGVSWNVGIGYVGINNNKAIDTIKAIFGLKPRYNNFKTKEYTKKKCDIFFNGSFEGDGALLYQRKKTSELINTLNAVNAYAPKHRIKRKEYLKYMKNCKLAISPFGYGEICFRDFETFIFGGCLIKPNMDHIETWPNYYKDNNTYKSICWDFSDFEDVVNSVNEKFNNYKLIANIGKTNYLNYDLHDHKNRVIFVKYFMNILNIN